MVELQYANTMICSLSKRLIWIRFAYKMMTYQNTRIFLVAQFAMLINGTFAHLFAPPAHPPRCESKFLFNSVLFILLCKFAYIKRVMILSHLYI